jgi:hypothetical protein
MDRVIQNQGPATSTGVTIFLALASIYLLACDVGNTDVAHMT